MQLNILFTCRNPKCAKSVLSRFFDTADCPQRVDLVCDRCGWTSGTAGIGYEFREGPVMAPQRMYPHA